MLVFDKIKRWFLLTRTPKNSDKDYFPRSLYSFSDVDAINAPISGIGSPNKVMVTIYKEHISNRPLQLTFAGCTGDSVLNSKIFSSLYSLALCADFEPTFISSNGGIISMNRANREWGGDQSFLKFALGFAGPIEPTRGIASIGMSSEESIMLVSDFLGEAQNSTGLIQIHDWHYSNVTNFEDEISKVLLNTTQGKTILKSSDETNENLGVIHSVPFLFKDKNSIHELKLEIPFEVIGIKHLYNLLKRVRNEHMDELLKGCIKRLEYAKEANRSEKELFEEWKKLVAKGKDVEYCKRVPFILIGYHYNFELGISVKLSVPEQIETREFEEKHRPLNIKSSEESIEKFLVLKTKLDEINSEYGKADIISLKYLIDSMIRRTPLITNNEEIQKEYNKWVIPTSIIIWDFIKKQAKKKGYEIETIAADNVIFNSELYKNKLIIKPTYLVDINDFIAEFDGDKGTMKIIPSGKVQHLSKMVLSNSVQSISDINSLYNKFNDWMGNRFNVNLNLETEKRRILDGDEFNNRRIFEPIIQLHYGRKYLFQQKFDNASIVFSALSKYDYAITYFWNALIKQFTFLEKVGFPSDPRKIRSFYTNSPDKYSSSSLSINQKIGLTIESLIAKLELDNYMIILKDKITNNTATDEEKKKYGKAKSDKNIPLDSGAKKFLEQLKSKNYELEQTKKILFIKKLIAGENIINLEYEEFELSELEMRKIRNIFSALSSIELLEFAEFINDLANQSRFFKNNIREIENTIVNINNKMKELIFESPSCKNEIEKLANYFNKTEQQGLDSWGVSSIKSQLYSFAELVAEEGLGKSLNASEVFPYDVYNVIIPSYILLKWSRSYSSAIEYILRIRGNTEKKIGDFKVNDLSMSCKSIHGIVKAEAAGEEILLKLNDDPIAILTNLQENEKQLIFQSMKFGIRLGMPLASYSSVFDRVKDIVLLSNEDSDEKLFYDNKEALIPWIARKGIKGYEKINETLNKNKLSGKYELYNLKGNFKSLDKMYMEMTTANKSYSFISMTASLPFQAGHGSFSKTSLDELKGLDSFRSLFGNISDEELIKIMKQLGNL